MFTGIIEEIGKLIDIKRKGKSGTIILKAKKVTDSNVGDSIAVNGVCLTVTKIQGEILEFDISFETLERTTLKFLRKGNFVNLERALKVSDRLGGHIVQGHVDTVTKIVSIRREGESFNFTFKLPFSFRHLAVEKGSIAIDGISLTISSLSTDSFSVAVIPLTYRETTLQFKKVGEYVNVEFDILGKYIERMVKTGILSFNVK